MLPRFGTGLLPGCTHRLWGGRRLSMGGDVAVMGATDGATAAGGC